jgi:hypothetical protein
VLVWETGDAKLLKFGEPLNGNPEPSPERQSRIISAGYVSRSVRFRSYLGLLLRRSNGFVEVSPGLWTLQTIAHAA